MSANQMSKQKEESIWSAPFLILMFVNFFANMAAFMTNTTIPVLATALGASVSIVGVIVGMFPFAALLIRPFAGPAFDSFSRKRLLIILEACASVCLCLYGVVDSVPMIMVVRFFHGIFSGCVGPLTMSLVSEFLPLQKFASGISIYALSNSCAQIIGPATGLYLVEIMGFSSTYFLAGACLLVSMCTIFAIREPYHEHLKYELKLNRMFAKEAVSKMLILMLLSISFSCVGSYVVLYGYSTGVMDMGFYFVVYACCLLATRPLFGRLADSAGSPKIIFMGIIFFVVSFIALSMARDMVGFVVAAIIGSAGFGSCAPLLQSMALASVPVEYRGAASNTMFTGIDIGNLCGPIMGGLVVESLFPLTGSEMLAYADMWIVMLVPTILALLGVLFMIYRNRRRKSTS